MFFRTPQETKFINVDLPPIVQNFLSVEDLDLARGAEVAEEAKIPIYGLEILLLVRCVCSQVLILVHFHGIVGVGFLDGLAEGDREHSFFTRLHMKRIIKR